MARKRTEGIIESSDKIVNDLFEVLEKNKQLNVQRSSNKEIDEVVEVDPDDWISSGASMLDVCVSNRLNAGIIAYGRMMELQGLEQCVTEDTLIDVEIE